MAPPLIHLGSSCCNLVKGSLNNNLLLRCKIYVIRSLAYTTAISSSDTNVVSHLIAKQKVGKFNVTYQWKREQQMSGIVRTLFARELKVFGFKHNVETYMVIVRLLLYHHSGMDVRLNHLFTYLIENRNRGVVGFQISDLFEALIEEKLIKAVDVLVEVYASFGRFDDAMQTVKQMKSRTGLTVSTRTCNFVMNELIEWDYRFGKVMSVYRKLKKNGLVPNADTYETLMKGYCKKFDFEGARGLLTQMEKAGVAPNAFICGRYIRMLCLFGATNYAFQEVKRIRESNQPAVDVFLYTCLIRGFVKESKPLYAEYVLLHDMNDNQVVPDADCYGELIQWYCHNGYTNMALDICKKMESRYGINTEHAVMRVRMRHLCDKGRHREVLDEFKDFIRSSKLYVDRVTFDIAIDAACHLGKMEDAVRLFERMKDRKFKPQLMHYRTLIDGYCLRGEPWNALCMFQEMVQNGLGPNSATYNVLARGFKGCRVSLPLYMLFKL